jgi:hypothetical protein
MIPNTVYQENAKKTKQIALVKYDVLNPKEGDAVAQVHSLFSKLGSCSVCLVDRNVTYDFKHIPVFGYDDLLEFPFCVVALDIRSARLIEKSGAEHKFFVRLKGILQSEIGLLPNNVIELQYSEIQPLIFELENVRES